MANLPDPPWRIQDGNLLLRVRLTPRSAHDSVEGIEPTAEGSALKARVRAVAQEGEANAALERLIAKWLGVPASTIAVGRGGKSRVKTLRIAGDPEAIRRALEQRCRASTPG